MAKPNQPSVEDLFDIAVSELELSITKPNILNYVPYPEQERFHRSTKKGRYVAGGNRGGKTDSEVVEAIWWATNTHPYLKRPKDWGQGPLQLRFVVVDVAKGVEQIILPKLKRWLTRSMLIEGSWDKSWDSKNLIFTFSNGSTIDFLTHGMTLDKHGGVPRHIIFFDEEPPQPVFNESMMRLIDYDGLWVIAATPVQGMGWTFDLLWEPGETNPDDPDLPHTFTLSAAQNPYLKAETFDRFMIGMNKEEREVRETGKFVARSGLVFPTFATNLDKFVHEPIIPPRDWKHFNSGDFGYNNPTAWLWHAVAPSGDIITYAEHYASGMVVSEHARIIHEREKEWGRVPDLRVGDPAGNQHYGTTGTSYIAEYAMRGIHIQTEMIPREVAIGIEKMQQYFAFVQGTIWNPDGEGPRWVISSNCHNLIRELKKLRWKTYASERMAYDQNKAEEVHKKDDHAFDSARYFATVMPDLTPDRDNLTITEKPVTISYQEMLVKLEDDPNVTYVDSEMSQWETTYELEGHDEY